ncbi:MAG TPA: thiamine pyrophosphate-binding protein [Thermohalobaculum sp.]|nr:thiamine pyrophosphate-binding protein [Thermohalobaculum sp.]
MTAGTNQPTGAEAMVRMLAAHGVRHIFGLCGDTSLPFYDALARLDHGMTHILTRDERHAAYMADAYARVTGRVGICEGPSGGGATYILPGIVEANESSVPVLAITSDVATTSAGRFPLTELDQQALFAPLTKWNGTLRDAGTLPRMVRRAFREMTTGRPGAAHLCLPFDVQKAAVPEEEIWADAQFGTFPALRTDMQGEEDHATRFVASLLESRKPVIVCGGGVVLSGAEAALQQLAERLDLPVATTVSGQGAIAETHPNAVGVVGSNGGRPGTRAVVDGADCVVFIGCRAGSVTTERWRSPAPGTRILHIDSDPRVLSACYRTDVCLAGDARSALTLLNLILDGMPEPRSFAGAARAAAARAAKAAEFAPLAASDARPIKPERVIETLNRVLPDDAVVCADPGTPCPYFSAYYTIRKPGRHFITNRAHGALGYALAASVGAQIGRPNAKVVAAMGDGSFGMCVGEFETIVRLGLPITSVVFSNSVYGWIKAGQKSGFGGRYYSVDFTRTDHAAVAAAYGVKSWRVEDPAELEGVLRKAIAHDGPTLVDIIAEPLQDAAAPVSEWVA